MYSTYWTPFYRCQEAYYKHSQIETLEILCYTTKVNAMSQEDIDQTVESYNDSICRSVYYEQRFESSF